MTEEPAKEVVMPKSYEEFNAEAEEAPAIDSAEASIATPAPEDIAREQDCEAAEDSPTAEAERAQVAPSVDKRPHYECHKTVYAHKIAGARRHADGSVMITPAEEGFTGIRVLAEWVSKHAPHIGDYIVYYEDGYVSVSPAKPFEAGYTLIEE